MLFFVLIFLLYSQFVLYMPSSACLNFRRALSIEYMPFGARVGSSHQSMSLTDDMTEVLAYTCTTMKTTEGRIEE